MKACIKDMHPFLAVVCKAFTEISLKRSLRQISWTIHLITHALYKIKWSEWHRAKHFPDLIARFTGPTWGPSGADRTQTGPKLAPWTLLCGLIFYIHGIRKTLIVIIVWGYIHWLSNGSSSRGGHFSLLHLNVWSPSQIDAFFVNIEIQNQTLGPDGYMLQMQPWFAQFWPWYVSQYT